MFKLILVAALVASAAAIDVTLCPGQPGPASFAIRECPSTPCDVAVGQSLTLDIGLNVVSATTTLPVFAIVTSGGREFPFDLPTGNACAALNGSSCPLAPGTHRVTFPITIEGVNAGDETTVRVQFNDDAGNTVACGSVTTTFV